MYVIVLNTLKKVNKMVKNMYFIVIFKQFVLIFAYIPQSIYYSKLKPACEHVVFVHRRSM